LKARRSEAALHAMKQAIQDVPRCASKHGTITIVDGDDPSGWTQYQLAPPAKLLKVLVQRSGCFNLVDRGSGLETASRERAIGGNLGLRRRANVGQGQIKAADYVLVAEVQSANRNASGNAVGGIVGGLVGGLLGGIKSRKLEANTVLSLTNVRTAETIAVQDGYAAKNDIGFGAGARFFGGAAGTVGGGYENTDIGRIVTLSFIQAYAKMVIELKLTEPGTKGAVGATGSTVFVAQAPVAMRTVPSATGKVIGTLSAGSVVYPTRRASGLWWEVADQSDRIGWVLSTKLAPGMDNASNSEEPFLPWPPPRPSSMGEVTRSFGRGALLGEYGAQIKALLARKGYTRLHYFGVRTPNGFGITTDIERLDAEGKPHAKRWTLKTPPPGGFLEYVDQLLRGDTGRFRVLLFIVSDQDPKPNAYLAKQVDLERWRDSGGVVLSGETSRRPAPSTLKVWMLVYEFVVTNSKSAELIADNDGAFPFSLHSRSLGFQ